MEKITKQYFKEEKKGGWILLLLGGLFFASSMCCTIWLDPGLFKGMASPIGIVGLIQMVTGATIVFRTDSQLGNLLQLLKNNPQEFFQLEEIRMNGVMINFQKLKIFEQGLLLGGFIIILLGMLLNWSHFIVGIGIGMILQGGFSYVIDLLAEDRAFHYMRGLTKHK